MASHEIPPEMSWHYWSHAPQPDAEGTFALWLLRQTNKLDITRKAQTSGVNLYTEVLECLETVENSEAEVSHVRAVLDKIEQATKHILAAFSSDKVELAWQEMSADIPTSTWNWWEPSRDPRSRRAGKIINFDEQQEEEKDEEPSLAIAKIKPEMLDLADCELPSISTEWGARFREIYFGGFVVPKETKENQSNQDNTTTMHGIKGLFLCAHSILRHLWILRRMAGRTRAYYSVGGLQEDITPLWREFGRLLGFTVMDGPGVYSSDINGIGKCGLVLQFPRIPNYVISVQFEVELGGPKSMTEFLSTLLALTSGLNFEDWVWEEKEEDTQEQQQQQQQQEEGGGGKLPLQGPPPLLPTVLPIGLMLCPLGVVRAQYQAHSKRYVCDKHPSWKEHADELVFELLSRAMRYDDGNNNNNNNNYQQQQEEEEEEAGCFELCSSPLPHDTLGEGQEGKSSSRLADPSLLVHVNKQSPRMSAWIEKEEEEEEEEGSEEGDSQEEESNDEEAEHDSKRHKSAQPIDDRSSQGSTFKPLDADDTDAGKENGLPLQQSNERVKQWPLNAYFLSQLGKFSRKENFERWRKTRACVS